jgi:hypothetical protein
VERRLAKKVFDVVRFVINGRSRGVGTTLCDAFVDAATLAALSSAVDLRSRLTTELNRRLDRNPRYSLRAFARSLALHHTTVARLMNGTRRPSGPMLTRIGRRLGLSNIELTSIRRHELAARVLDASQLPDFRADCRWIAMKTGVELDDVNRALHLLIHERRLEMSTPSSWTLIQP